MKVFSHDGSAAGARGHGEQGSSSPWYEEIARMRCLLARLLCAWGGPPNAGAAR